MGLFDPALTPDKDYISLENDFLLFADAIGARPSVSTASFGATFACQPTPPHRLHYLDRPNQAVPTA